MGHRERYVSDCIRVIDERVVALERQLASDIERHKAQPNGPCEAQRLGQATDRVAIMEAKHLARLLASLLDGPYRKAHPYIVAMKRTGWPNSDVLPSEELEAAPPAPTGGRE